MNGNYLIEAVFVQQPDPIGIRELPDSVLPNAKFDVVIHVSGCGIADQVIETLPTGFTYISINDSINYDVTLDGQDIQIIFMGDAVDITYQVQAPATEATYTFGRTLMNFHMIPFAIGGNSQTDVNIPLGSDQSSLIRSLKRELS